MEKETFNKWNILKQEIENKKEGGMFKERDIFYINMGKNIGFEQDGKGEKFLRPVLIFKKFNNLIFLGIPLTSKIKKHSKFYFEFCFKEESASFAILSQIRLFDWKRLERKIGMINKSNFIELKKAFIEIIK